MAGVVELQIVAAMTSSEEIDLAFALVHSYSFMGKKREQEASGT